MLDAAQAIAGLDALDAELAEQLARAVFLRAADPDARAPTGGARVKIGWIDEKTRRPSFWK